MNVTLGIIGRQNTGSDPVDSNRVDSGPADTDRAYSLIEFAMAVLLTIPVIIAILDLTRVFQATSTARAAIDTALRCLTATDDPGCSVASSLAGNPEFNLRLISAVHQEIPLVSYGGAVKYIEGPQYQIGPFTADVLSEGVAIVSGVTELHAETESYSTIVDVRYSQIDSQIVPGIIAGTSRDPVFQEGYFILNFGRDPESEAARADSGSAEIGRLSPVAQSSRSEEFMVPEVFSRADCLNNQAYPGSDRSGLYDCFATAESGQRYVRGILHVKGAGRASDSDVCGRALLYLEMKDGDKWRVVRELSGQSFQGIAGNFVPRGYNNRNQEIMLVDSQVIPRYYLNDAGGKQELSEAFKGQINFLIGKKYRVSVRTQVDRTLSDYNKSMAKCAGGTVEYSISGGTIYFPALEQVIKSVKCAETSDSCRLSHSCREADQPQISSERLPTDLFSSIQISSPRMGEKTGQTEVLNCGVQVLSDQHFQKIVSDPGGSLAGKCSACNMRDLKRGAERSDFIIGSAGCPPSNRGVADGLKLDGIVVSSAQAENICPIETPDIIPEDLISRYWTLKPVTLAASLIYPAKTCSELEIDTAFNAAWNDNFSDYLMPRRDGVVMQLLSQRSSLQSGRESAGYPLNDSADPDRLINDDSRYSCGSFRSRTVPVSQLEKKDSYNDHPGIFDNDEPVINCLGGAVDNIWKANLASYLRRHYLDVEEAFFSPAYYHSGRTLITECKSNHPAVTTIAGFENCIPVAIPIDPLSTVIQQSSDCREMPEVCRSTCNHCQCELRSHVVTLNAEVSGKVEKAIRKGREQLRVFSPWLSRDCDYEDCVNFSIQEDGVKARADVAIRVPLFSKFLGSSLLGKEIFSGKNYLELKVASERLYEREMAR